jgi:hypothetical protein
MVLSLSIIDLHEKIKYSQMNLKMWMQGLMKRRHNMYPCFAACLKMNETGTSRMKAYSEVKVLLLDL